ncbi:alpha/beta fold hydrolase [Sulfurovum sp.]|uniref:alpha/beta hydrolase family protein n=1 Tax=Sulfurovum sp. TaxID=1969726 RepID=UPI0025CE75C3|nr:alpha/beta fold hydrolase [Sulfurovum sp.]
MVILHGWGGNAEQILPMALPFHQAGMNVLLVDARNHGRSDRDTFSSLPRFAEDLEKAIEWLKYKYPGYSRKIALLGHSVGGGAVLFAASRRNDIDAVISISAFAHPEWMMQRFLKRKHIPSFLVTFVIRYVEWVIGYRYEEIAPVNTVCRIKCPVLLVHGKADLTVPVEDALIIKRKCKRSNIRLLAVESAGHESVEKIKTHTKELVEFLRDSGFPLHSL